MRDDLDDLICSAMKTLDDQVPAGYFESLPEKTLARLGASMQSGSTAQSEREGGEGASGIPAASRDEDSGLHDIRSLAQSARMRAVKRGSTSPPISDDAIVAATSGAWNAVALPEPAKMVALPELEELPPAKDIVAKDKVAHPEARRRGKGLYAVIGVVLAAAAGAAIYVTTQSSQQAEPASVAVKDTPAAPAPAPAPVVAAAPTGAAAGGAAAPVVPPTDDNAAAAAPATEAKPEKTAAVEPAKSATHGKGGSRASAKKNEPQAKADTDTKKAADKPAETKKSEDGEPSFDALLKEAGADQEKKPAKPKLDKKELTGEDFKHGIGAVAKKAQGCYKGTQGTAVVKLTIAPSGSVSKVTVVGSFAGTPEGDCVQKAVQGATFPPWDGGPQSFTYSYLLSE